MKKQIIIIFFIVLGQLSIAESATKPVYKFVMAPNQIIKLDCIEDGVPNASKMAAFFDSISPQSSALNLNLKIKACTHSYGQKKFNFIFQISKELLNQKWLQAMSPGDSQTTTEMTVQRINDLNGFAYFALSSKVISDSAPGVQSIVIGIPVRADLIADYAKITQKIFMWSSIQIIYKGGFLMPTVDLNGQLSRVDIE